MAQGGCEGPNPGPPRHPHRPHPAGEAQADLQPGGGLRGLRGRGECGGGDGDGEEGGAEGLQAPYGVSGRAADGVIQKNDERDAGEGFVESGQRDAAQEQAEEGAAISPEGLPSSSAPLRRQHRQIIHLK